MFIVGGSSDILISYNAASERVSALHADGHREDYSYTADGYLEDTRINGVLRARRVNDALGRVTSYIEFDAGTAAVFLRGSTYNNQRTYQGEWSTGKNTNYTTFDMHTSLLEVSSFGISPDRETPDSDR